MNKQEFIAILRRRLDGLPYKDIEKSVEFYSELIEDRVEDGLSEEEAVKSLGSIDDIVVQILADTPLRRIVKEKVRPKRALLWWEILIIIVTSPLWLPIVTSLLGTAFSVYFTVWAIVICMYLVSASFLTGAIVCVPVIITMLSHNNFAGAFFYGGGALVCGGITIITFILSNYLAKMMIVLSKEMLYFIKSRIISGGGQ